MAPSKHFKPDILQRVVPVGTVFEAIKTNNISREGPGCVHQLQAVTRFCLRKGHGAYSQKCCNKHEVKQKASVKKIKKKALEHNLSGKAALKVQMPYGSMWIKNGN